MDEDALADALRRATDDVSVPRDLVRHAERLGRERRARRRSRAAALSVTVVVLAGGALVVQGIGGGSASSTSGSASSAAGSTGSDTGAVGSDAAPSPDRYRPGSAPSSPTFQSGPQSGSGQVPPQPAAPGSAADSAACSPSLAVDGVPSGRTATVRAGAAVEVTGDASCGPVPAGTRYVITLVRAPGAGAAATDAVVLAEVVPAADGSFDARVTVPATTAPGPAVLSARVGAGPTRDGSGQQGCRSVAGCPGAAAVQVTPAQP